MTTTQVPIAALALLLAGAGPSPGQTPQGPPPDAPAASSPAVVAAATAPTPWTPDGVLGSSIPEIVAALDDGSTSSVALVAGYLARIQAIDRSGPTLQSVLSLNPRALEDARDSDARRATGQSLGRLEGVPILLKDNIESADPVATTAGALALADNITGRDSPLVAGLRAQGAVILGKTNLSQWANFRSNDSISGWSALGGQVHNPHMLDRSPCGSSSGSGAAVAASLAAGAVGTETNGSISCPSTVNGVVGFKPTVGLVSQRWIVPISSSQDTAGPMTRTVAGAALMMNAMVTADEPRDFVAALDAEALRGVRIGVGRFAQGSNARVIALFDRALADLEAAGAVLVEIEEHESPEDFWGHARTLLRHEFKATVDAYLADAAPAVTTRDLAAVIAFNRTHSARELALFDQSIFDASVELGDLESDEYVEAHDAVRAALESIGLEAILAEHEVVALVTPSGPISPRIDAINGDVWPEWAGAGWMAAIAGLPHLTVPMGEVSGLPIGISFLGSRDDDARILALGHAYEVRSRRRVEPRYLSSAEARPEIERAMSRAVH